MDVDIKRIYKLILLDGWTISGEDDKSNGTWGEYVGMSITFFYHNILITLDRKNLKKIRSKYE